MGPRLVQGCMSTLSAPSSAHSLRQPLTQPFLHTDHWPCRDPPHSKAGYLAPETHTSHSFYPSYLLFSYPTRAVYSLNHNQATNPPAPNTISTAAGPHRGPCPRSGHSWEQLSSDPRTLLLSLPLPHRGSAPLGGGGGGGHHAGTVMGPLCGHMVQRTGRTGCQAVLDSRQKVHPLLHDLWGLWVIFSDFSSLDLSAISCAYSWCPVWKHAY